MILFKEAARRLWDPIKEQPVQTAVAGALAVWLIHGGFQAVAYDTTTPETVQAVSPDTGELETTPSSLSATAVRGADALNCNLLEVADHGRTTHPDDKVLRGVEVGGSLLLNIPTMVAAAFLGSTRLAGIELNPNLTRLQEGPRCGNAAFAQRLAGHEELVLK